MGSLLLLPIEQNYIEPNGEPCSPKQRVSFVWFELLLLFVGTFVRSISMKSEGNSSCRREKGVWSHTKCHDKSSGKCNSRVSKQSKNKSYFIYCLAHFALEMCIRYKYILGEKKVKTEWIIWLVRKMVNERNGSQHTKKSCEKERKEMKIEQIKLGTKRLYFLGGFFAKYIVEKCEPKMNRWMYLWEEERESVRDRTIPNGWNSNSDTAKVIRITTTTTTTTNA